MIYKAPGVYIVDTPASSPAVAEVETAIPAFLGHTEKADFGGDPLANVPFRITSMLDYENAFGGGARPRRLVVTLDAADVPVEVTIEPSFLLHYSLQLFFANGGGPCYVVSVGGYEDRIAKDRLLEGINSLEGLDEPTLIVFPDGSLLEHDADLGEVQTAALAQCATRGDRFAVLDLREADGWRAGVDAFRDNVGDDHLRFGAAYTPHLQTTIATAYTHRDVEVVKNGARVKPAGSTSAAVGKAVAGAGITLPPGGAVAGAYAQVDARRGVWKAPANVSLNSVTGLTYQIDDTEQGDLNVDVVAGKSINAIRAFPGRGILVWGARTLAGNDNEWRYVPVRRFVNMVEESVDKSTRFVVFEPNDASLWTTVKAMVENYLQAKWRAGALAGATPAQAFFVRVGLGETMTSQDILDGRLVIEIGLAVARPAEFIIVTIVHRMQASA